MGRLLARRLGRALSAGLLASVLVTACATGGGNESVDDQASGDTVDTSTPLPSVEPAVGAVPHPILTAASSWQWQLQGEIDTSYDVDVYDVDLFELPDDVMTRLHADGRVVICYFSAGSFEEWRPDVADFAADDLGADLDGWEGERWLDIRSSTVRQVMERRLDLAVTRGCDGVEPDNVDGSTNETGFDLTLTDQLDFDRTLAAQAHRRGLLVGLKNSGDQASELIDDFDFAVVEQCHEFDECDQFEPFITSDKPVFNAEYQQRFVDDLTELCADAQRRGFRTLVLPMGLDDSFRSSCD